MAQRVLAILAAIGMVVVAIAIRQAIDDDDGGDDLGSSPDRVVVCAAELVEACNAFGDDVEVRAEPAADTAAALTEGSLADDVDAWVTSTAWLEVLESRAPDAVGDATAVATSPTVVATAPGRYDAITDLCADTDVWRCLGDHAGEDWANLGDGTHADWRELKVGLTDPDGAVGLAGLASVATGYFGTTDFAVNDPQFSAFEAWLANLAEPSAAGDPDPARTLATRPGTYSAAGTATAIAQPFDARGVETLAPDIDVPTTVAMVEVGGGDGAPDADPLREALVDGGWARAGDGDLAPTLKPGVMAALHSLWRAVTT